MKARWLAAMALVATVARGEEPAPARKVILKAAHLFDGTGDQARSGLAVLVEGDRIGAVGAPQELTRAAPGAKVIDLGAATLLPGLIDGHTHLLVSGDVSPSGYDDHLVKQSVPYRAIVGAANARTALMFGFTSLRDVESEGAMFADADLKEAIASGVVPGPRLQVSTRGLAPTGGYLPFDFAWDVAAPSGAQTVDGPDQIRRAVREQIKFGADWIKVYADFSFYPTSRADRPLRSHPNFTLEEMKALVDEAHRHGKKVAAHANGWDAIDLALRAPVDSVEHGFGLTDDLAERMVKQGVLFCPTLTPIQARAKSVPRLRAIVDLQKAALRRALAKGVKIANGSDAGSYPWTDNPVTELLYLVEYGMTPAQALRAATAVAGELLDPMCSPEEKSCPRGMSGVVRAGAFADLIAVDGEPLRDLHALQSVRFVMKGGVVYKGEP